MTRFSCHLDYGRFYSISAYFGNQISKIREEAMSDLSKVFREPDILRVEKNISDLSQVFQSGDILDFWEAVTGAARSPLIAFPRT